MVEYTSAEKLKNLIVPVTNRFYGLLLGRSYIGTTGAEGDRGSKVADQRTAR